MSRSGDAWLYQPSLSQLLVTGLVLPSRRQLAGTPEKVYIDCIGKYDAGMANGDPSDPGTGFLRAWNAVSLSG
jgi:hypothetical protein